MNRYDVSFTMKVKSVRAGEYTAPPAHGPMIIEIYLKYCKINIHV